MMMMMIIGTRDVDDDDDDDDDENNGGGALTSQEDIDRRQRIKQKGMVLPFVSSLLVFFVFVFVFTNRFSWRRYESQGSG